MTPDELAALAKPNAGPPQRPISIPADAIWLWSTGSPVWNTPDGKLSDGNYEPATEGIWMGVGDSDPVLLIGKTSVSADQDFTVKGSSYSIRNGTVTKA